MSYNQNLFNQFIVENGVIGFFDQPVTLKSGRQSNWYVNWRTVSNDAYLLDQLTEYLLAFIHKLIVDHEIESPDTIYGVPEGATKLGILSQYKWAKIDKTFSKGSHVIAMGRGKAKTHGAPQDRLFVGMPRAKTLVIEDVTTTGDSLLTTIDSLIESDIEIIGAIGLTNRMEMRDDSMSVESAVSEKKSRGRNIRYFHMSSALDLLPLICSHAMPREEVKRSIEKEFSEFGVAKISL